MRKHGIVMDVELTAENVHDSLVFDPLYGKVRRMCDTAVIVADAASKTPWITKRIINEPTDH